MSIIPQHTAYPRTFVAQRVIRHVDGEWETVQSESDESLNNQLERFVDEQGATVTQVSAPSVQIYEGAQGTNSRVYITSVSILYIPATEGIYDGERDVDSNPPDPPESVGDIHREPDSGDAAAPEPGDGGS